MREMHERVKRLREFAPGLEGMQLQSAGMQMRRERKTVLGQEQ